MHTHSFHPPSDSRFWLLAQGGVCRRGRHVQRDHPRARLEDSDRWRCRSKLSGRNSVSLLPSNRDHSCRSEPGIKKKGEKICLRWCRKLYSLFCVSLSLLFTVLTFVCSRFNRLHLLCYRGHQRPRDLCLAHHSGWAYTSISCKVRKQREWPYLFVPIFCVSSLPKMPFQCLCFHNVLTILIYKFCCLLRNTLLISL